MKAKLTIEGREIEIELTTEQVDKILPKKEVKSWEDLGSVDGWFINSVSIIDRIYLFKCANEENKNVFATENQAKGVLAMAQLSQLMKHYNGDWKPDWASSTHKYVIACCDDGRIVKERWISSAEFLAFPTKEIRDKFLDNHRELIEECFLIYQ